MIKIIIAGGRDFNNHLLMRISFKGLIIELKEKYNTSKENVEIISGGAKGADHLGEKLANHYNLQVIIFPADWNNYGKSAGYIRNIKMAEYAKEADDVGVLLAFWDGKSKGTKHMIDIAEKHGLMVKVVKY